jgi:hypothetical protein
MRQENTTGASELSNVFQSLQPTTKRPFFGVSGNNNQQPTNGFPLNETLTSPVTISRIAPDGRKWGPTPGRLAHERCGEFQLYPIHGGHQTTLGNRQHWRLCWYVQPSPPPPPQTEIYAWCVCVYVITRRQPCA